MDGNEGDGLLLSPALECLNWIKCSLGRYDVNDVWRVFFEAF